MRTTSGPNLVDSRNVAVSGKFIERLSAEAIRELDDLKAFSEHEANSVLFKEDQVPTQILFLLTGQVKLSMNSSAGKRLILGIAHPGETLGLASVLSETRYDITAETICPCRIASLYCKDFLEFLMRHPAAYKNVVRELSTECARARGQVRALGLAVTAPARLARLLLEWCADGQKSEGGTRFSCSLTHGEIGEYIGASRETVTRIFSEFRYHELLESRGSTLIISNRRALKVYAGMD
ncbi:MAG TPA: Crp/Fnr family transcriptional regulator [Terracidiphilus sp.]|nr:Crp/Fnr family transcriptional regulator [Terracidiphilus sp.]